MSRWALPSILSGSSHPRERFLKAPLLPELFREIHHGGWMLTLGPRVQSLSWTKLADAGEKITWMFRPASVLPTTIWGIDARHRVVLQGDMKLVFSDGRSVEHRDFGAPDSIFGGALRIIPVPVDLVQRPRPKLASIMKILPDLERAAGVKSVEATGIPGLRNRNRRS